MKMLIRELIQISFEMHMVMVSRWPICAWRTPVGGDSDEGSGCRVSAQSSVNLGLNLASVNLVRRQLSCDSNVRFALARS
jgi:hypothetical protein